ncbi:phosphoesterase, partial [Clostridium perfringens]|nr:phosphoesterase [Clostridium perfringens]
EGIQYLRYTNSIGLNAIKSFFNISDINIDSINKIVNEITPREGAISKKDNAKIIVELLTTNDKDRAEQITKYIYNEKIR